MAFLLEDLPAVATYDKNKGRSASGSPNTLNGDERPYAPDFLLRMRDGGMTLIVEVSGEARKDKAVPKWFYNGAIQEQPMPVDLSIKRVPDDLAERLRERAKRNHRSLQGELRAILEDAADMRGSGITREAVERFSRGRGTMTIADLNDAVQRLGISTPDSSVEIIRQMRDVRGEHIERVLEQSRRRSRRVRGR